MIRKSPNFFRKEVKSMIKLCGLYIIVEFIDYITEMVLNEQMASFKRTEKCDVFSKTDVEFANRHGFKRESLNSNIFISMYRNYVKKEIIKLLFSSYFVILFYIVTFKDKNYGTNNFILFKEMSLKYL